MDPNKQNPQGGNDAVKKLEEDLQNLTKQAATPAPAVPEIPPAKPPVQVPEEAPVVPPPSAPTATPSGTGAPVQSGLKKDSPILVIAIVFAVVAVLAVVAYVFGGKLLAPKSTPSPSPTEVSTPSPTPDPTANWQSYTNSRYLYLLRFPENWAVTRDESDKPAFRSLVQLTQSNYKTLPNFIIEVSNKSYTDLLDSSMKAYQLTDSIAAQREETVTGAGNSDYLVNIVFQDKSNAFQIQASFTNPPDQNELAEFNQILSTFKFVEATPAASPTVVPLSSPSATATP